MKFNVYLFREEVVDFDQVFRPDRIELYQEIQFIEPPPFEARAYLLLNKESTPPWARFFANHCRFPDEGISNISNSFVLVIRRQERLFALAYGQGYLALDRQSTDPTFGLNIALNAVMPDRIRSTESRNLKETATLKQLVLSRNSGLEQFDVDFDHEVLHRLEGALPDSAPIGSRIRGSQACAIVAEADFAGLGDWCEALLNVFRKELPERMKRTQTLRPVDDAALTETLNGLLVDALLDDSSEALHLSPSDVRDYNRVTRYQFVLREDEEVRSIDLEDLDIDEVRTHLEGLAADSFVDAEPQIRGLDEEGEEVAIQPLLTTVVFETEHDGQLYVHQPHYWVKVSQDLVERLDRRLANFTPPGAFSLPDWDDDKNEGTYNDETGAANDHLMSLDRRLVSVAGSRIEACDLLSKEGELIHVKEYKSSQSITHLVAQAQVASDLLLEDRAFREGLQAKIEAHEDAAQDDEWTEVVNVDRVRPSEHPVVLAIGAKSDREVPSTLPYLGKQALLDTLLWLQRQGYPCFVYKVDKG